MRNQEAARYARWSAIAAMAIALIVAAFYSERALRDYIAARHGPAPVPAAVQQDMGGVSYSFSDRQGTTFTIRASHATQFKEGDHALLQDVWVTIYGKKGDRNDNIHTQECSYQPNGENVQCTGEVDIDVQASASPDGKSSAQTAEPLHVVTSNITFDRVTGEASTPAPVTLTFDGGQGHGTGLQYSSEQATLRVQRDISLNMAASERTGGMPVSATAANLEFHRDQRTIALGGPVVIHQGDRQLTAGNLSIALDKQYHAQEISGGGNPVISGTEKGASFTVSAQKFDSTLDATGAVQQLIADGGVTGTRKGSAGEDHFSAARVEFAMVPGRNLLKQMTATGGVRAESHAPAGTRTLKTDALQINFAAPTEAADAERTASTVRQKAQPLKEQMDQQRIESAETLGPATIDTNSATEKLELKGAKFSAQFGADGKLSKLQGHSGVQVTRTPANGTPQTTSADELSLTFGAGGDWSTIDETGNVRLAENGEGATAGQARMARDSGVLTLDGSPVFTAAGSRTSAGSVTINQKTGEISANGGVVTTEMATAPATNAASGKATRKPAPNGMSGGPFGSISLGQGDAHISGETLSGSMITGDVTFRGHARLWQGGAVLEADQISVSRDAGKLEATGNVIAVFPQAPGQGPQLPAIPAGKTKPSNASVPQSSRPAVWQIQAQRLTFSNDKSMAHLDGGVTASSAQGTMHSQTLDVYLAPSTPAGQNASSATAVISAGGVQRVVAQGNVTISQDDVHGHAEQADYDAVHGKFTFSGGEPNLTDGNGNTFSGHSLTYDVASDTISIVSDGGSRTLTTHRVEK